MSDLKLNDIKSSKYVCYICCDKIEDEEFEYEDYYAVKRGHNDDADFFICFDCGAELKNKQNAHSKILGSLSKKGRSEQV